MRCNYFPVPVGSQVNQNSLIMVKKMNRDCSGGGKRVTRQGIENGGPLKERDRPKVNCESSHNRKPGRAPLNQSDDPGRPND